MNYPEDSEEFLEMLLAVEAHINEQSTFSYSDFTRKFYDTFKTDTMDNSFWISKNFPTDGVFQLRYRHKETATYRYDGEMNMFFRQTDPS